MHVQISKLAVSHVMDTGSFARAGENVGNMKELVFTLLSKLIMTLELNFIEFTNI